MRICSFSRKVLTELEASENSWKTESDDGTGNEYWRFGFGCGAIKASGVGIAMGNAPEWLKEEADFVTAPFDKDGVAIAIEKYILNKQ